MACGTGSHERGVETEVSSRSMAGHCAEAHVWFARRDLFSLGAVTWASVRQYMRFVRCSRPTNVVVCLRRRSLIVEFNRNLQPQHSYTVLHDPDKMWDVSDRHACKHIAAQHAWLFTSVCAPTQPAVCWASHEVCALHAQGSCYFGGSLLAFVRLLSEYIGHGMRQRYMRHVAMFR